MRRYFSKLFLITAISAFILVSCSSLFPKRVEFLQDKVKAVPTQTTAHKEAVKEVAELTARLSKEANIEAIKENSSTNLVKLTSDTSVLADSLSYSIGKPLNPWKMEAELLALKLNNLEARLDKKLDDFSKQNNKNQGKKIEGTGWFSMSYFTYIGGILLLLFLIKIGLKVYSAFNPAVGIGLSVASVPVNILKKGFSQVIKGAETFKTDVEEHFENKETQAKILALFQKSQQSAQDQDVQKVIQNIT